MSLDVQQRTRTRLRVFIGFSPAAAELHTVDNTLASSSLSIGQVVGFTALQDARDARVGALDLRLDALEMQP